MESELTFNVPAVGSTVIVNLSEEIVGALRDEHPDYPTAANHALADRVGTLLNGGHTEVQAVFVRLAKEPTRQTVDAFDLLVLRCPELTGDQDSTVLFCAGDCRLTAAV